MQLHQDDRHDSETDEGFIPSKIMVQQKHKNILHPQQNINQSKQSYFQPRYITEGIMKKQPPQAYSRFSKFDFLQPFKPQKYCELTIDQNSFSRQESGRLYDRKFPFQKIEQKTQTAYEKFVLSSKFTLVYGRTTGFQHNRDSSNFTRNDVNLRCLENSQEANFKLVKPFQSPVEIKSAQGQKLKSGVEWGQKSAIFDSKFQCGNLLCAFNYCLLMQNDTNSNGYNQWFYFSITNIQIGVKYKFRIMNFRKRNSFFRQGNCPVVFSYLDSLKQGKSGYSKRGINVQYKKSPLFNTQRPGQNLFELTFQLQFSNQRDIYYISMGLPYSYSRLIHNLQRCEDQAKENDIFWETNNLGNTIANNKLPYLTITKNVHKKSLDKLLHQQQKNVIQRQKRQKKEKLNKKKTSYGKKKVIFIMARQHPGETWSSYLMEQILNQLSSPTQKETHLLLQQYIIKCVPMVNIDGVISGNFRCDLVGTDLNRNWKYPSKLLHPQNYAIKNEVIELKNKGFEVDLCLDLHGHSKQYNVFCYSCKKDQLESRVFPFMISELNSQFHFPFCTFGLSKYKQSTARAALFDIVKHSRVLTIQCSFFASKIGQNVAIFQPENFKSMSQVLLKASNSCLRQDQNYKLCKKKVEQKLEELLQLVNTSQKGNNLSGSDSEPSADEIEMGQKLETIIPRNLQKQLARLKSPKKTAKKNSKVKKTNFQTLNGKNSFRVQKASVSESHNRTINVIRTKQTLQNNRGDEDSNNAKDESKQFRKASIKLKKLRSNNSQTQRNNQDIAKNTPRSFYFRNLLEKEDNKILFASKEKAQMAPLRFKNESFEIFQDAYTATQKYIRNENKSLQVFRNQKRNSSRKFAILKEKSQKDQEFPLLCVLSENKKKSHAQRQKYQNMNQKGKQQYESRIPSQSKTIIQTRTEAIQKLREKNKNSMQLVSKIWRQNFARYGMAYNTFKISK